MPVVSRLGSDIDIGLAISIGQYRYQLIRILVKCHIGASQLSYHACLPGLCAASSKAYLCKVSLVNMCPMVVT